MSAHLAQVKIRFWQRVARFRIYTGKLLKDVHSRPGAKKKSVTLFITYSYVFICYVRAGNNER